jgi:hypothetical protein
MSESPGCPEICEIVYNRLIELGFQIDGSDEDHTKMIEALNKTVLLKDEDYCPLCETVCSNVSAMLADAGIETDGDHDLILNALNTMKLVPNDQKDEAPCKK